MSLITLLLVGLAFSNPPAEETTKHPAISKASLEAAAKYNREAGGTSFWVQRGGKVVHKDFPNGGSPERALELASGTKSFSAIIAAAAVQRGILKLDEKVSDTITEWKSDRRKSQITVQHLLNLSGGLAANHGSGGPLRQGVPSYKDAITFPTIGDPDQVFQYGPSHFQVFGELMRRKLHPEYKDPLEFLNKVVFEPAGIKHGFWRRDRDGMPHIPSGAHLTAENWAKVGQLVLDEGKIGDEQVLDRETLRRIFRRSSTNRHYGLTFWLHQVQVPGRKPVWAAVAAGLGDQRMFVVPDLDLVVVRQNPRLLGGALNREREFDDGQFLNLILGQPMGRAAAPRERNQRLRGEP
ncbi:MAG: serine hydrolase domain-containing protein [Fimbriimonadaceae bacterium]